MGVIFFALDQASYKRDRLKLKFIIPNPVVSKSSPLLHLSIQRKSDDTHLKTQRQQGAIFIYYWIWNNNFNFSLSLYSPNGPRTLLRFWFSPCHNIGCCPTQHLLFRKGQAKVEIIIPNPAVFQSSSLLPQNIQRQIVDAVDIIKSMSGIYFSPNTHGLD